MSEKTLVVGLGNPGPEYADTYHNVGFRVLDRLTLKWGWAEQGKLRFGGMLFQGLLGNKELLLLKPLAYMNLSGQVVRLVMDYYKIPQTLLLVVSDDLDLPLGELRFRLKGSAGGHNGLKDIIRHLGTDDFARLKVGIGRDQRKSVANHVLSKISKEAEADIALAIDKARDGVEEFVTFGKVEKALKA